jgi:hypothetical protein
MGTFLLSACEENPAGAGGVVLLRRLGGAQDSVLVGAPGRPLAQPVAFQVLDGNGAPIARAAARWTVLAGDGSVEGGMGVSDPQGRIEAGWVLGTVAADTQRLVVEVQGGAHTAAVTVTAVAVPVEISAMACRSETTLIKLGVPAPVVIDATDPFGNHFVPRTLGFVSLDTALAAVDSTGSVVVRKRGYARIVARHGELVDTAWVHGTQVVQSITVSGDTLRFRSIGQTLALAATLVDDGGRTVLDSLPTVVPADTAIVSLQNRDSLVLRSLANGSTVLRLQAGAVSREMTALVRQRVASVTFAVPPLSFDALTDTSRASLMLHDSLGTPIERATITFSSSDSSVASVDTSGLVTARANGSVMLTARSRSGVTGTLAVAVQQRVARVVLPYDTVRFEALHAVTGLRAALRDRLGWVVPGAFATYATTNAGVALVDASGDVQAIGNGTAEITAAYGIDTVRATVHVAQRPVRVVVPRDTVRFVALGDSETVTGVAVDSLGSAVAGDVTDVVVGDTAVSGVREKTLEARANGVTTASLSVAGLTRQVVVVVSQVPTALDVAVTFSGGVVTLPAGSSLPLACTARDRNGFALPSGPALVRSVRGTVTGAGCDDARVERSGYDTLVFAAGAVQRSVPVIVATRPDSIGIIAAAQPLTDDISIRYVGEDLADPSILALRPLVQEILAAYGNPTTNLGRARAIRDWVARTAVHPSEFLHPRASTSNTSVLPPGVSWGDVNAAAQAGWDRDLDYWTYLSYDGYVMLDRLLGTLDRTTGVRADDGIMQHVAGAQYRMRDLESYRFLLCTFQSVIATTLWAAAGMHGLILQTLGHDPSAVFIPEIGKWVYEDVTFSNEYLLDGTGDPLSPVELLNLGTAGTSTRARVSKLSGPSYDPQTYIDVSYMTVYPEGFVIMGSRLYKIPVPNPTVWNGRFGQIDVAALAGTPFDYPIRVTPEQAFPRLGVVLAQVAVEDSVHIATLSSTFPNHDHFERRTGASWQRVDATDVLPVGAGRVEYRSVDVLGNVGATTVLDIWIPRADGFLAAGAPGSPRTQAGVVAVTGPDF